MGAFKTHPEIDAEVIQEPVFVLGLGRSGTTILQDVLSHDPQFRSVQKWESLFPWPAPEAATPEVRAMHDADGDQPVADTEFSYPACMSEIWTTISRGTRRR